MSRGKRVPLEDAEYIAGELKAEIVDYCSLVVVAGSIRRRVEMVGDIDLVCVPVMAAQPDLFGNPGPAYSLLDDRLAVMLAEGVIFQRLNKTGAAAWGPSLKRGTYAGLGVDIQSVTDPDTLGAWLLIRTGPAEFNKALVTERRQGGLLPAGFKFRDGFKLYRWDEQVPTPTEHSVFDALGLPYAEPWERGR